MNKIVISDTSVIANLIVIDSLYILEQLFEKIVIPTKVHQEVLRLSEDGTDLSQFANATWIEVCEVSNKTLVEELCLKLDRGEAEAIALYLEMSADKLLIDERKGRKIALSYQINITGLIGCLIEAKRLHLIDNLKDLLEALKTKADFRMSEALYADALRSVGELRGT